MKYIVFLFFLPVPLLAENLKDLESSPNRSKSIKYMKIDSLSDLQKLTPKDTVSVIQKRYLPKTFRGEYNLSLSTVINHTFFYLGGAGAKAGVFIREDHGFGLEAFAWLPPLFKMTANDMIGPPNNIVPLGIVLNQYYAGIYYKWSPVFGKFAVLNRKIVYFDMYMTFGAGMNWVLDAVEVISKQLKETGRSLEEGFSKSTPKLSSNQFPAFSIGTGQMFSITKDWAFNWELKWLLTVVRYSGGQTYTPWDINFSIGMNYYFPGAKYR